VRAQHEEARPGKGEGEGERGRERAREGEKVAAHPAGTKTQHGGPVRDGQALVQAHSGNDWA
jgi:hypothetical protein